MGLTLKNKVVLIENDEILKDLQLIVKEKNIDLHIVHKSYSSYQLEEMILSKVDNEK